MKLLKRIAAWMLFSLALQGAVLYYLDRVYFKPKENVNYNTVIPTVSSEKEGYVKIPEGSSDIEASNDGNFISYSEGNRLKIVSTLSHADDSVDMDSGAIQFYYKWLEKSSRIIIAEKFNSDNGSIVKFFYYDVIGKSKQPVGTGDNFDIKLANENSVVEQLDVNEEKNIIYAKVSINSGQSLVYKIKMDQPPELIITKTKFIGQFRTINSSEQILYEDVVNKKIFVDSSRVPLYIKGVSKYTLLGTGSNGIVYIGEITEDKITRIFYGRIDENMDKWQVAAFKEAVNQDEIFISETGEIYLHDKLKGLIVDMGGGKELIYEGRFICAYRTGVLCLKGGQYLEKFSFK